MLRWESIPETVINGVAVKMYRPRFVASRTQEVDTKKRDIDHVAFESSLRTELFTYRVLDVNFVRFMEERGDPDRIKKLLIPVDTEDTVV